MDTTERHLIEAWRIIESAEAQRIAVNKARKSTDKAKLGIQKAQKKADIARLDQQLAGIGEAAPATIDEGSSPALTELQKEVVLLRQVTIDNGKLLRAILERL